MFINKFTKFKKEIEKTIYSFFNINAKELNVYLESYKNTFKDIYDLDNVLIQNVRNEMKNDIMRYKTMKYFCDIYTKLIELEDVICEGERL